MKVVPHVPQYKKDPNHTGHLYGWVLVEYRGYLFLERRVLYKRIKQKDSKTEVIQVKHLGKSSEVYPFGHSVIPNADFLSEVLVLAKTKEKADEMAEKISNCVIQINEGYLMDLVRGEDVILQVIMNSTAVTIMPTETHYCPLWIQ